MKAVVVLFMIACTMGAMAGNQGMLQTATRRVMDLFSLAQKQNFLVITTNMVDQYVPGNVRALDLAKALRADGHSVTVVSKNGPFAPEFSAQLEAVGVEMHSVASEPHFFTDSLLKTRKFDAAFLYLWFWGSETSVPQTYIPSIRAASANTKIIVVTDDAHTERAARLNTVNQVLSAPFQLDSVADEMAVYAQADAVMTVSEADQVLLESQLKGMNVPVFTAHWGHQLSSLAIPSTVAPFERRSGVVFVGYGNNPSNKIGLQWFFEKVYPNLKGQLANERYYIVGDAPADGYASLAKSGAHIIPMAQRDDVSMRTILASARVMIAPIFSTGLTTKVLLGMSNGLPVVATRMAAQGYQWAGQEAEFAEAMVVAANAQQFAEAVVRLSTNGAEWAKYSAGGLKLARLQTSPARFAGDVRTVVADVKARAVGKASASFVAPASLRSEETKIKTANPWDLMTASGSSSSSSGQAEDPNCGPTALQTKAGVLGQTCKCNPLGGADDPARCNTEPIVCHPNAECKAATQKLLDCKDNPIMQLEPYKSVLAAYMKTFAECASDAGSASPTAVCSAAVGVAAAAAWILA